MYHLLMSEDSLNKNFNLKEFSQKSEEYYNSLKPQLEATHKGKYVALDFELKRYWIGGTATEALAKAKQELPDRLFYLIQVGASAPFAIQRIYRRNTQCDVARYGYSRPYR